MKIYLYLEKKEYVNTWINGGKVPLKLASTYLSEERRGIYTPDEVLQQSLTNAPLNAIQAIAELSGNAEMIIDGPTLIINN